LKVKPDKLKSFDAKKPKQYPHDYSCRVPLIMNWEEGLRTQRTSDLLVGSMDLMPTILGLLGIDVPKAVQGQDLSKSILTGDDDAVESVPMFMFTGSGWRGVYTKDWTYSAAKNPSKSIHQNVETNVLFNHKNDPAQMENLFDDKDYADIQNKLAKMSEQWMKHFEDKWYAGDELLDIMDLKEWNKYYTYRPIDLLQKK
jgi:arylsulfatase A-like enzyme